MAQQSKPPDDLDGAQKWYQEHLKEGVLCPCCKRHGGVRRRNLTATMVKGLLALHNADADTAEWVHLSSRLSRISPGGDPVKLRYWGLIEPCLVLPAGTEHEKRLGLYKITSLGCDFIEERIKVPRSVWVYRGKWLRHSGKMVMIREVLGSQADMLPLRPKKP